MVCCKIFGLPALEPLAFDGGFSNGAVLTASSSTDFLAILGIMKAASTSSMSSYSRLIPCVAILGIEEAVPARLKDGLLY